MVVIQKSYHHNEYMMEQPIIIQNDITIFVDGKKKFNYKYI